MMKNYHQTVKTTHNPNWTYTFDKPYRILIIAGSGSEETNALSKSSIKKV